MTELPQEYLFPSPPQPAIDAAMAKAAERKEKSLPVHNFASGNVGALALNIELFDAFQLNVARSLPEGFRLIADGIQKGLLEALYPQPSGLAYSPVGGITPMKKLALRYFKEVHGVPFADDELNRIIVTAGGQQAMAASLRSLKPETEVLLLQWDYAPIPGILKDHGLKEIRVKLREDLSLEKTDFKKKLGKNQVFYLSMPNNPTGYTSVDDLKFIIQTMVHQQGGVIWDAPYIFTILRLHKNKAVFDRSLLDKMLKQFREIGQRYQDDLCILSSLSKTSLTAGLRIGMATATAHWITNMKTILGRENLSSPTLSFAIGKHVLEAFLNNPICHEWTCQVLANRLTLLMEEISDYLILPQNGIFGALYTLVKTPLDGSKFAAKLVTEKGIVGVPGSSFYGAPVNALRLSLVATPWTERDETWTSNVEALKNALNNH